MKQSAGILLYKFVERELFVLLAHPGGPFWKNKDAGSWSIPKGELNENENPLDTAIREFQEETGMLPNGELLELTPVKLKSGKLVHCWACAMDIDADAIISNDFEMEWPPKSGIMRRFPEIDKVGWFTAQDAKQKVNSAQAAFIDELVLK
ncbi:MAG: NUDIX domain-containing protein, partial [Flavobacterium sp.]